MAIAFYVLFRSEIPLEAKIILTALPLAIWFIGSVAVYREYRNDREDDRRQEEILKEARRILSAKEGRGAGVSEVSPKTQSGRGGSGESSRGSPGKDRKI